MMLFEEGPHNTLNIFEEGPHNTLNIFEEGPHNTLYVFIPQSNTVERVWAQMPLYFSCWALQYSRLRWQYEI